MQPSTFCRVIVLAVGLLVQSATWSHGYMTQPASRSSLCKNGANTNCGAIVYEPQSLEFPSGFPNAGPADGAIGSAGLPQFSALNEQTSSRWTKRDISAGPQNFSWQLTAFHRTRGYRYYMTRQDWNPNAPLTRASFDLQPFCTIDSGNQTPPPVVTHQCNVPQRSGYQVILGVWEIGDTINSFYNTSDVMFSGGNTGGNTGGGTPPVATFVSRGTIFPSIDLQVGDKVSTRVFNAAGEQNSLKTTVTIGNATEGQRNNWSFALASRVNTEQPVLRAGQLGSDGKINPVFGQNDVYSLSNSGIARVEIQIEKAPVGQASADVLVGGLIGSYAIANGQVTIDFSVTAVSELDVSAFLYDASGTSKGFASPPATLNNTGAQLRIAVNQPAAGRYQLVVKGTVKATGKVIQKTFDLTLTGGTTAPPTGNAQFVFPAGLGSYKAGTLVQQPKNGKIYECRPFPYSGYCAQWTAGSNQFEPGVGANWREAWLER
jgi:N-acetylglucosamine-binding protein A